MQIGTHTIESIRAAGLAARGAAARTTGRRMLGLAGAQPHSTAAGRTLEEQKQQLKELAGEMEGLFISVMMRAMRSTVPEDPLTGGGFAEETFQAMADVETARDVARSGGFGIGKAIYEQLARHLNGRTAAAGRAEGASNEA